MSGHVLFDGQPAPMSGVVGCSICGGSQEEGSLPTECPEVGMTDDEKLAVMGGASDYCAGMWCITGTRVFSKLAPPAVDEHTTFHVLCKGDTSVNIPDRTAEVSVIVEGADAHAVGTFRVWLAGAFAVLWGERACDVSVLTAAECEAIAGPESTSEIQIVGELRHHPHASKE